jgi:rhodanese-related sulfurtransferase
MNENKNIRIVKFLVPITIALSFLAVIAGSPYTVSIVPTSVDESFDIIGSNVKVIDAKEIASWIIKKRNDFNLFDIRTENEFKEYHIPHAININDESNSSVKPEAASIIVIYDESNRYSIEKIKPLIKDRKGELYLLKGGMSSWMNEILFPDLRATELSKEEINRIYKTSSYFGGKPLTGKERTRKKYSREGC